MVASCISWNRNSLNENKKKYAFRSQYLTLNLWFHILQRYYFSKKGKHLAECVINFYLPMCISESSKVFRFLKPPVRWLINITEIEKSISLDNRIKISWNQHLTEMPDTDFSFSWIDISTWWGSTIVHIAWHDPLLNKTSVISKLKKVSNEIWNIRQFVSRASGTLQIKINSQKNPSLHFAQSNKDKEWIEDIEENQRSEHFSCINGII